MNKIERPVFLSALCLLTFFGSGFAFVAYFLTSINFERVSEIIIEYSSWYSAEKISPLYFTVLMVLYALSLTGAIRIWKFHRDGFFIYSISQLIILFLPVFWLDWQAFSITNAIITVVFISAYVLNLKYLK